MPNCEICGKEITDQLLRRKCKGRLIRSRNKGIIGDSLWYLKQMSKLNFLSSLRFWALCLIALGGVLQTEGVISQEVFTALATILGGFTAIRTIDKFSQK
jgi:hypothetical protein